LGVDWRGFEPVSLMHEILGAEHELQFHLTLEPRRRHAICAAAVGPILGQSTVAIGKRGEGLADACDVGGT
jgi:hypothetical protein